MLDSLDETAIHNDDSDTEEKDESPEDQRVLKTLRRRSSSRTSVRMTPSRNASRSSIQVISRSNSRASVVRSASKTSVSATPASATTSRQNSIRVLNFASLPESTDTDDMPLPPPPTVEPAATPSAAMTAKSLPPPVFQVGRLQNIYRTLTRSAGWLLLPPGRNRSGHHHAGA